MKKITVLAGLTILFSTSSAFCVDNISNNIAANLNQRALDAFAKDIGALVGGGSFHQGKNLGFPLGVDVGVHGVGVEVQDENTILRDDSSRAGSGWAQAEVGLPLGLNLIARGGRFEDAKMVGGGLRVGLFTAPVPLAPSVSVTALYDEFTHDYVEAQTVSANAVLSVDVPFVHPYLGVGWDRTELDPTGRAFDASPGTSRSLSSSVNGYRAEAGVNISLIPFTYLTLGAGSANSKAIYHAGFGAKF